MSLQPVVAACGMMQYLISEVRKHRAFHHLFTPKQAEERLQGAPPFTYALWLDSQNSRISLSFVDPSLKVAHCFMAWKNELWHYQNGDPHRAFAIEDLIPIAMHCKMEQCKILSNHLYLTDT